MKVLTTLVCVFLLTAFTVAQEYPDNLVIGNLSAQPAMDAVAEAAIYTGSEIPIAIPDSADDPANLTGTDDLSGFYKIGWFGDSLYVFFDVTDDVLDKDDAGAPYENDGVEIYFDGDNSKLYKSADGINDVQLRIERDKDIGHMIQDGSGMGITVDWYDSTWTYFTQQEKEEGGYVIECSFSMAGFSLPDAMDTDFGWDCQINDADGAARTNMLRWHAHTNDAWHWAYLLGTAQLSADAPPTGINEQNANIVESFTLDQNYPNPFNPTTSISYNIAQKGQVTLTVYNVLGKEVATLVNGIQNAGPHSAVFNAANLSSGVYFYTLQVGSNVETKKMILIK
jgi:hypothetical protein